MNATTKQYGFADPLMLEKIDNLFACGLGELVDLPQIVVVGDQSSGKSSVLEGLIKKPLPRNSGLCTRFATQIVFRRAPKDHILVSIIPDRDALPEHSNRLKSWGRTVSSLDSQTFKDIMEEAHEEMGLSGGGEKGHAKRTFSNDVLRLEISGPDQEHLSVIDVPGIFKSTTKGLTTKADILLVRRMVKGYMDNPRSVLLAVVPANTDLATQEILELAAESDLQGDRTLGVLTKPDLVDKGAEVSVIELLEGRVRPIKLGWHIIRNPGQQQLRKATIDRDTLELDFFRCTAPWDIIEKGKVGVDSLRGRLKEVLSSSVKREFPEVKAEVQVRLDARRKRLDELGPERHGTAEQMVYLIDLASRFQRLVSLAVSAIYGADEAFEAIPAMRVAPAVRSRVEVFSNEMDMYGHTYAFTPQEKEDSDPVPAEQTFTNRKVDDLGELVDILHHQDFLHAPLKGEGKAWLSDINKGNRGFELGTFNASILATAMRKQCAKWEDISLGLVSDVIVLVHQFIDAALATLCKDRTIRDALRSKLFDHLVERYKRAMDTTRYFLRVENSDTPMTLNPYFNDNLQKSRKKSATAGVRELSVQSSMYGPVQLDRAPSNGNNEHEVQEIHSILHAYYKVSRQTFVDNVCKHSAIYHLLRSEDGPLAFFSPVFVSRLSPAALEEIAGEAPALRREREGLTKEITSLTNAMKVLART